MTAIISSIQKANADDGAEDTPKKSNASQAGNAFGGKESAKRSKTESVLCLGSISINNKTCCTYYSSNYLVSSSHLATISRHLDIKHCMAQDSE